jgi:O-antigen/teichoic acid export membrane protein
VSDRLARHTIYNLSANLLPLVFAVLATPFLVHRLGTQRFGLFTLALTLVGYFGLFDLGFGRALTKLVAERLAQKADDEVPSLVWTALAILAALGVCAAVCFALFAQMLVQRVLAIPPALHDEALKSLYVLALCTPFTIQSAALQGVIEGHQRFDLSSRVRVALGILLVAGPLVAAFIAPTLFSVITALVLVRICAWLAYLISCVRLVPALATQMAARRRHLGPLLRFGGWLTVSNIVGPLAIYADRFLVGSLVSLSAVAYYAVPYDTVTRLWFIPDGLLGVLFPAFTTALSQQSSESNVLFKRAVKLVILAMFPVALVTIIFAHDALLLWLGADFASHSTRVAQWLAAGVFINSVARVPFVFLQSAGRPDLLAKLQLVELPFYVSLLLIALRLYGIEGCAMVWTIRIALVGPLLFLWAGKVIPGWRFTLQRWAILMALSGSAFWIGAVIGDRGLALKIPLAAAAVGAFTIVAWQMLLTGVERDWLLKRVSVSAR